MMTLNEVKQALANGEDVDCMPYYKQLLKNSETSYSARFYLFDDKRITKELIDFLIIYNRHERHFSRNSVYIKWQALHAEGNLMTNLMIKTMSWAQLYTIGHPWWAYPFSLSEIGVLRKLDPNAPLELLEKAFQPNIDKWEMCQISQDYKLYK